MSSSDCHVERAHWSDEVLQTVSGCGMLMMHISLKGTLVMQVVRALRQLTGLLVVEEATVDAAWYLIPPIKDHILFCILIVVPCIAVIISL